MAAIHSSISNAAAAGFCGAATSLLPKYSLTQPQTLSALSKLHLSLCTESPRNPSHKIGICALAMRKARFELRKFEGKCAVNLL